MRFEKYRNTLIPIERVMWVEFNTKGDWMENEPSTFVHLFLPNGLTQAIEFKGNQVNKINEWLKQFPEAGSCASGAVPSICLPEHRETPDSTWNTDGTDDGDREPKFDFSTKSWVDLMIQRHSPLSKTEPHSFKIKESGKEA